MVNRFLTRVSNPFNEKRIASSMDGDGKTEFANTREWNQTPSSQHTQLKMINNLNIGTKIQENIRVSLHDLGFGNGFSEITPKAQEIKEKNRWNGIHLY